MSDGNINRAVCMAMVCVFFIFGLVGSVIALLFTENDNWLWLIPGAIVLGICLYPFVYIAISVKRDRSIRVVAVRRVNESQRENQNNTTPQIEEIIDEIPLNETNTQNEIQISEIQISEIQMSEIQMSETQISETQISETQISETQISEISDSLPTYEMAISNTYALPRYKK